MKHNPATKLLHKLRPSIHNRGLKKVTESTGTILIQFQDYLEQIKEEYVSKDHSGNDEYVIGAVFKNQGKIKEGVESHNFAKITLSVANRKFKELMDVIKKKDPALKRSTILKYKDLITDYIYDVKPFVEYFKRKKEPDFFLFRGGKSYNNYNYEIFAISKNLYWNSMHSVNIFDQKMALNISCFALRQSLEIKFKRLCGIYDINNKDFDGPKLRHDFFPDFIENNKIHFNLPYSSLSHLVNIYKWTNLTIHNAENPRIWELKFALDYIQPFFKWGEGLSKSGVRSSSIFGAIKITDAEGLKEKLLSELNKMSNEIVCIDFIIPEAIVLD